MVIPLLMFLLSPLLVLYNAWAFQTMWNWFVHPLGLPMLGLANATGLFTIGLIFARYIPRDEDDWPKLAAHELINPGFAVFVGWIIKGFM